MAKLFPSEAKTAQYVKCKKGQALYFLSRFDSNVEARTTFAMKNYQLFLYFSLWCSISLIGQHIKAQSTWDTQRVIIRNETLVNTNQLEFSPVLYKNGIVFISTRHEGLFNEVEDTRIHLNTMSIYRSKRDAQGVLQAAQPMGGQLISTLHEGPVSFDATTETIYFTRNDTDRKAKKDGLLKLRIYAATKTENGGSWENVELLPFNIEEYNTAHPSLAVDGDKLYYASDRADGFGGMDIYVVEKKGDGWGIPRNLGPEINTADNEVFPFIHADGTLYFSSNGHSGQGGLDLYRAQQTGDRWGAAVNMGTAFNTPHDDFGLVVDRDNRNGYFSSDRPGGLGADDIYSFHLPQGSQNTRSAMTTLRVTDKDGYPISDASISYLNLDDIILSSPDSDAIVRLGVGENDNELVFQLDDKNATSTGMTDTGGQHDLSLQNGRYIVKINKAGYLPQQLALDTNRLPETLDVRLVPAVDCVNFKGIVLDNLNERAISGATISVRDNDTGTLVTLTSDERGQYEYCLKCSKSYTVTARKNGATSSDAPISTLASNCGKAPLGMTLYLDASAVTPAPIAAGTVINLKHIYYNFDDASLRPDARSDLDAAVAFLQSYPDVNVELGAHTDARGSSSYNQLLSQRRANNAVDYIISRGISVNRIVARGYGESRLKNDCMDDARCSELAHQQNRRTEITILNTDGSVAATSYDRPVSDRASNAGSSKRIRDNRIRSTPVVSTDDIDNDQVFMVVAGTFRNAANADERLEEVRNLGYYNARVQQLSDSPYYYAVVVDTFAGERQLAKRLVNTLERQHRLNAYVRTANR
ncbi:MAG: carboxypeptidase regulatory-like domain-containing protein [Bacteroidota bacterium]